MPVGENEIADRFSPCEGLGSGGLSVGLENQMTSLRRF